MKSHSSALCWVPRLDTQALRQIQVVRYRHDKGFIRWPPHINLLYPFVPTGMFSQSSPAIQDAIRNTSDFKVTLSRFQYFQHSKNSFTLWLDPEPQAEILELQKRLWAAFPGFDDLNHDPNRHITAFTPHLSVGQFRSLEQLERVKQELESTWEPITCNFSSVVLIARNGYLDPFATYQEIPLAGARTSGAAAERSTTVVQPYVASVGPLGMELSTHSTGRTAHASTPTLEVLYPVQVPAQGVPDDSQKAIDLEHLSPMQPSIDTATGCLPTTSDDVQSTVQISTATEGNNQASKHSNHAKSVLLFAYDSMMSPRQLGTLGVKPIESHVAKLHGCRVVFNHRGGNANITCSNAAGTAASSIAHSEFGESSGSFFEVSDSIMNSPLAPCHHVFGVLHKLHAIDLARVCLHSHEYIPVDIDISTLHAHNPPNQTSVGVEHSQPHTAVVLVSPPARQISNSAQSTTQQIKRDMLRAAREVGLPQAYCARLDQVPCMPEDADLGDLSVGVDGAEMRDWPRLWTGSDAVVGGTHGKRKRGRKGRW